MTESILILYTSNIWLSWKLFEREIDLKYSLDFTIVFNQQYTKDPNTFLYALDIQSVNFERLKYIFSLRAGENDDRENYENINLLKNKSSK